MDKVIGVPRTRGYGEGTWGTPSRARVEDPGNGLTMRQREVMLLRLGYRDGRRHLLREIGARIGGVTTERVRQIEARACHMLCGGRVPDGRVRESKGWGSLRRVPPGPWIEKGGDGGAR